MTRRCCQPWWPAVEIIVLMARSRGVSCTKAAEVIRPPHATAAVARRFGWSWSASRYASRSAPGMVKTEFARPLRRRRGRAAAACGRGNALTASSIADCVGWCEPACARQHRPAGRQPLAPRHTRSTALPTSAARRHPPLAQIQNRHLRECVYGHSVAAGEILLRVLLALVPAALIATSGNSRETANVI
jgi:hypothetical protein